MLPAAPPLQPLRQLAQGLRDRWRCLQHRGILQQLPTAQPRAGTLVVLADGAGDYLLARTYFELWATAFPGEELQLLLGASLASLQRGLDPGLSARYYPDAPASHSEWAHLALQLRQQGFRYLLHPLRTRYAHRDDLWALAAAAAESYAWAATSESPPRHLPRPTQAYTRLYAPPEGPLHELQYYQAFTERLLGQPVPLRRPRLPEHLPALPPVLDLRAGERPVLLALGARFHYRRWPLTHFAALARELVDARYPVVLVGGSGDIPAAARLCAELPSLQSACGSLSWAQTGALMRQARLTFTGDTGSYHLALAAGCPTVCISNGNHLGRFAPYPAALAVAEALVLPPGYDYEDPRVRARLYLRSHLDIGSISPAAVWQAAEPWLAR